MLRSRCRPSGFGMKTRRGRAATIKMDEKRIASSRNAPERTGHCLTRMLPSPRHIVNRSRVAESPLSCSIGEPAFPSRPGAAGPRRAAEGIGRSGATRSHARRAFSREHGEDGEHRTFPEVSTVAHSAPVGGPGHRRSTCKRYVTEPWTIKTGQVFGRPVPALAFLQRFRRQTPFYVPSAVAIPSTGVAASAVAHRGRRRAALLQPLKQFARCPPWLGLEPFAHQCRHRHERVGTPPAAPGLLLRLAGRTHLAFPPCRAQSRQELLHRRALGAAASPVTGRSAISTNSC
jgi:hypothetical protein